MSTHDAIVWEASRGPRAARRSTSSLPAHHANLHSDNREPDVRYWDRKGAEISKQHRKRSLSQPSALDSYEANEDLTRPFTWERADAGPSRQHPRSDSLEEQLIPSILGGDHFVNISPDEGIPSDGTQAASRTYVASMEPLQAVLLGENVHHKPRENDEISRSGVETFARQLRRSRALVDEGLLKRTQWRQALDTLEHSRVFLMNSTAELMSYMQKTFRFQPLRPRERQRAERLIEKTTEMLRAPPIRPEVIESPPATSESGSFGDRAQSGSDSGIGSSKPELRPKLDAREKFEQYCKDYNAVLDQEEIVKSLATESSNLDYELAQVQQTILDRMKSRNLADDLRTEMLDPALDDACSEAPERSKASTPPLVREYFDRQGDVGIWRERLIELDYAHEEGRVEREFLKDRGDRVDPPDDEFELNYDERRQHIQEELRRAEREAEKLLRACATNGFNTEIHRKASPYMYTEESIVQSTHHIPGMDMSSSPIFPTPAPLPAPIPSGDNARIGAWLREVSNTPGPEASESPEASENHDMVDRIP